jgi:nitrilase
VWLVSGVNEVEPERPGTIYNALLYHAPDGSLALHHRKLVPTNHERLIWGQGDGRGLNAVETGFGRVGGLICWENYMPLARFALYESGVEIYVASTADDSDEWQSTLVHIARESRAYVVSPSAFQRASSYPDDFPLASELEGAGVLGRGGSAILAPDGSYLAGPLYDEEGILYAELDPGRLLAERQRFDPVGHYHRPDVLRLGVSPSARAADATPSTRPSA